MNKCGILVYFLFSAFFILGGCKKQIQPTTIEVKDPDRHYFPILQGQELNIVFQLTNTGTNPLFVKEIQPSCGCIVVNKNSCKIVPPGEKEYLHMIYNSTKNVGLVSHSIRMYGNIVPSGMLELKFDVNVVPDADYTRDYEELFRQYNIKNGIVTEFVDGEESERGYYTEIPEAKN